MYAVLCACASITYRNKIVALMNSFEFSHLKAIYLSKAQSYVVFPYAVCS